MEVEAHVTDAVGTGGLFIAFEGGEGAGKSTHLRRLTERLDRLGIAHLLVREPGGTPAGERIRQIVLDPETLIFAETELLLYLASRAEFVNRVVRPALERGELVLADRFEMSTYAYQGLARGLGLERVKDLTACTSHAQTELRTGSSRSTRISTVPWRGHTLRWPSLSRA